MQINGGALAIEIEGFGFSDVKVTYACWLSL